MVTLATLFRGKKSLSHFRMIYMEGHFLLFSINNEVNILSARIFKVRGFLFQHFFANPFIAYFHWYIYLLTHLLHVYNDASLIRKLRNPGEEVGKGISQCYVIYAR